MALRLSRIQWLRYFQQNPEVLDKVVEVGKKLPELKDHRERWGALQELAETLGPKVDELRALQGPRGVGGTATGEGSFRSAGAQMPLVTERDLEYSVLNDYKSRHLQAAQAGGDSPGSQSLVAPPSDPGPNASDEQKKEYQQKREAYEQARANHSTPDTSDGQVNEEAAKKVADEMEAKVTADMLTKACAAGNDLLAFLTAGETAGPAKV